MYRIGIFSKLGRVTIKTLRHYDEMGLLTPAHVDEENGYRYYTPSIVKRIVAFQIAPLHQSSSVP